MHTSTTPSFGAPIIGQTEKALNAILRRQLDGTGLIEPQWVTLTVTVAGGGAVGREELVRRLAGVFKVSEAEADARIDELVAARLLQAADGEGSTVSVTDVGQRLHARIRESVAEVTNRLWGDLPPDDLATAGRVLGTVLSRAGAELDG